MRPRNPTRGHRSVDALIHSLPRRFAHSPPGVLVGFLLLLLLLEARAADIAASESLPGLIHALHSNDPAVRDHAVRQLVVAGRDALDPLVAGLREGTIPVPASFEVIVQLGFTTNAETARLARIRLDELARSPDRELAAAAWRHRRELDRRIAAKLRELGAVVFLTDAGITEVKLERHALSPEHLRLLHCLPQLTDLSLEQTDIDDAGLALLGELPTLEWLNLYQTRIGDDALRHINRFPRLESLAVGETRVTGAGLVHLKPLNRLEYLGLRGNAIADAALPHLAALTNLTGLHLGETRVTDAGLHRLAGLSRLQQLWLNSTRVSDAGIEMLLRFKQLKRVDLTRTAVSEEGVRRLRKALPGVAIEH